MFTKIATIAIISFVAAANQADSSVGFPLPLTPENFEANVRAFVWDGTRLSDTGYWGTLKWSSDLNMMYDAQGVYDDEGDEQTTSLTLTDLNEKISTYYDKDNGCGYKYNLTQPSVREELQHAWDNLSYNGTQNPAWDLTRNKYHKLVGNGVEYYYKQTNNALRFVAEIGSNKTRVYDYGAGFIESTFTLSDFEISQCKKESLFLQ